MQRLHVVLSLIFIHAVASDRASGDGSRVTPVEKVIQLLRDMHASGESAMNEEQVDYAAYNQFCTDTIDATQASISDANSTISLETSAIETATSAAEAAQNAKEGHESNINTSKTQIAALTQDRKTEHADFLLLHGNYTASIRAIDHAIQALKVQDYARVQASQIQIAKVRSLAIVPGKARKALDLFLAQGSEDPKAYAYEFQSGHVIDLLEDLLGKFKEERTNIETTEAEQKLEYDKLMIDYKAQVNTDTNGVHTATTDQAHANEKKAASEATRNDAIVVRDADTAYLHDLSTSCDAKAIAYNERQSMRRQELDTIRQAIDMISASNITGHAEKYLPSAVQMSHLKQTALAMLRTSQGQNGNEEKAHEFLMAQAQLLHSSVLSTLASEVRDDDPFAKVRTMIQDLITRLETEAQNEQSHKQYCDAQLAGNEQTRTKRTQEVSQLIADVDRLNASIHQLDLELSTLHDQISEINASVASATDMRNKEKATNNQTVIDTQEAQAAVASAIKLLKDFYEANALLQKRQKPDAPKIFEDEPYKGMQEQSSGIFSLLDIIKSDFARLESDTTSAEKEAQDAHFQFVADSNLDRTAKQQDIDHKSVQKANEESELNSKETELQTTEAELAQAEDEYEALKTACLDAGTTYEERVERRDQEIQSLQEALRILEGETSV